MTKTKYQDRPKKSINNNIMIHKMYGKQILPDTRSKPAAYHLNPLLPPNHLKVIKELFILTEVRFMLSSMTKVMITRYKRNKKYLFV